MHHPTDRITHTTAFVIPVVEHWLEREIAQWVFGNDLKLNLYRIVFGTSYKVGNNAPKLGIFRWNNYQNHLDLP